MPDVFTDKTTATPDKPMNYSLLKKSFHGVDDRAKKASNIGYAKRSLYCSASSRELNKVQLT